MHQQALFPRLFFHHNVKNKMEISLPVKYVSALIIFIATDTMAVLAQNHIRAMLYHQLRTQ